MIPVLDMHDPQLGGYHAWLTEYGVPYFSQQGDMVQRSNKLALSLQSEIIGWSADDQIFRTDGWDQRVIDSFEDPSVGFVFTNDLHYGAEKAVNIYTRREIIETLGWFLYPNLQHLYVDNVWVELGLASQSLVFLEDVIVEHMHPVYGKAENDAQYIAIHEPENYSRDGKAFNEWRYGKGLEQDAMKVEECLRKLSA
jgi:hypothetical protein